MKKLLMLVLVFMITATIVWAGGDREKTPKVGYIEPKNDHVADLTGKKSLTFKWKGGRRPAGGRMAYKFDLYKGFGYGVVVSKKLDARTTSITIPADKFEDGASYTWQVKQRDARTRFWSMDHRWNFKVKK